LIDKTKVFVLRDRVNFLSGRDVGATAAAAAATGSLDKNDSIVDSLDAER